MEKKNSRRSKLPSREKLRWVRNAVQLVFILAMPALFSQAFGGAKEIMGELGNGSVLSWSAFTVRLAILCLLTIVAGRVFCGWGCAFGAVGDWIYQLSSFLQKKTGKSMPQIPEKRLHILQKLKYIVLVTVLLLCFFNRTDIVTKYSPWTVFSLITAGNFQLASYGIAIVLLLLILLGMVLQERFFCQCLCPMGAIFSLLPELPLTSWKRNRNNCMGGCQACKKNCPVKIKLHENPFWEGECIRCGRCRVICPKKNIRLGIRDYGRKFIEKFFC